MQAKLIEYDYSYEDWDACKGYQTREESNRALLFFDENDIPIAIAISNRSKLEIQQVKVQDSQLIIPVWKNDYTILKYEAAPFQEYRTIKNLPVPDSIASFVEHAIICSMRMDDLRKFLHELIQKESASFARRI